MKKSALSLAIIMSMILFVFSGCANGQESSGGDSINKDNIIHGEVKKISDTLIIVDEREIKITESTVIKKRSQTMLNENEKKQVQMPSGEEGSRLEMPSGEEGSRPEKPSGEEGSRLEMPSGEEGSRPEMPSGEEGSKPEMPSGEEGSRPEMPSGMEDVDKNMEEISIDDVKEGDLVSVTLNDDESAKEIIVMGINKQEE